MDNGQKKRIVGRLLQEISADDTQIDLEGIEDVPFYEELGQALDALDQEYGNFLDFDTAEQDQVKWQVVKDVLLSGITYLNGSPSVITKVKERKMLDQAQHQEDLAFLHDLPQPDYYQRRTAPQAQVQNQTVDPLIAGARQKLSGLLDGIRQEKDFDAANNQSVAALIHHLETEIEQAKNSDQQQRVDTLTNYLTIANDLAKVNQLSAISIPNENGQAQTFCILAESAGGVTEKVSLVSLATVQNRLGAINQTNFNSVNDYLDNRQQFKLGTEAILKLPKHGKITEVQREAMALNLSRMLGLDTTQSSFMVHDDQPALFVPFDDIKLMSEFAKGEVFEAFGSSKTYEHYSTIKPVGAGLQSNPFIDDFGRSMGLFYACSDTDCIGGYNQNKALRNDQSLYIFDQVIMPDNKMILDSRLSLQPDQLIMKHTRHGQGRNRTLIEDSALTHKFSGLIHLVEQQRRFLKYVDQIVEKHEAEIARIDQRLTTPNINPQLKTSLKAQKKEVQVLRDDAKTIGAAVSKRIQKIYSVLPKVKHNPPNHITFRQVRQAMVMEKLLNNPMLFTHDGRPYRNPWTYRHSLHVNEMSFLDNGDILLKFNNKIPPQLIDFIKQRGGGNSIQSVNNKSIRISQNDLQHLHETMLHPELDRQLDPNQQYLNLNELSLIQHAYDKGHRGQIIDLMNDYTTKQANPNRVNSNKLTDIRNTNILLKQLISTAKDKGFGLHVMKKLQFDIQQRLQRIMGDDNKPGNLDAAFNAALKLDQVEKFNQVVTKAIQENKLDDQNFLGFLQNCVLEAGQAGNHFQAIQASSRIHDQAQQVIDQLSAPVELVVLDEDDDLNDINPLEAHQQQLDDSNSVEQSGVEQDETATTSVNGNKQPDQQDGLHF